MSFLIDPKLMQHIPNLYDTENMNPKDIKIWNIFRNYNIDWTWYLVEYDKKDIAYGLVAGSEVELGYFSISEISNLIICSNTLNNSKIKWVETLYDAMALEEYFLLDSYK